MFFIKEPLRSLPSPAKHRYSAILLFCILIVGNSQFCDAEPNMIQGELPDYEQGVKAIDAGNFEKALEIWQQAREQLEEPDFRISHSFITLVTEKKLNKYYTRASEIYSWGLTGNLEEKEQSDLLAELEFLKPLIGNGNYREYKKKVADKDPEVLQEIKDFWEHIDLTPLSSYNERLIEHWERIAFSKRNYTKANSDELDDRAHIYIKFGKPYYNKNGQLYYSSSFVSRILKEGIQPPSFASDEQHAIVMTQRMNLENRIRQYHEYQNYEVWIYQNLHDENKNTIFLFGTPNGTSTFRKLNSIDDFIPNVAYRNFSQHNYSFRSPQSSLSSSASQDNRQNIQFNNAQAGGGSQVTLTPALVLQLMYYQQFAALDSYFGRAFDNMMNRFINTANSIDSRFNGLAREFGTLYGNELIIQESKAPNEKTDLFDKLVEMPVDYFQYRFLDNSGEPYNKVFARIIFDEAIYYNMLKETNSLQSNRSVRYKMIGGYEVLNESGVLIASTMIEQELESLDPVFQTFDISPFEGGYKTIMSHELHNTEIPDTAAVSPTHPFPASLKGLHTKIIELEKPLENKGLILSDLIIGYDTQNRQNKFSKSDSDSIDFVIAHDKSIPEGSELSFYYELYNLDPRGTDNLSEYSFEYSIIRKRKGLFRKDEDPLISIDIRNTTVGDIDRNVITIDTSGQEKGEYEMHIVITDLNSNATFTKTQKFSIGS